LAQLVPTIEVEGEETLDGWLEKFVKGVLGATTTANGSQSPLPEANVEELETALKEKEQSEAQLKENVSHLTETLQRTRSSLANLQDHVEQKISTLSKDLQQTKSSLNQVMSCDVV
jgi:predicted nuclease with TOPRIM domain